jgi:F-type H+-transporting ATPase subunit gamma
MSTLQEVKKRIKSIEKTKKITNAMQMVAGAKLYKTTEKLNHAREMFKSFYHILTANNYFLFPEENRLWQGKKSVKNIGIIMLSSDKGLCGSFNTFIFKEFQTFLQEKRNVRAMVIGKKGIAFARKKEISLILEKKEFLNQITWEKVEEFWQELKRLYLTDQLDEIYILYNKFFSIIKQKPTLRRLLPVFPLEEFYHYDKKEDSPFEYILEPGKSSILNRLIELYGKNLLYKAFYESVVSEEGSRMNAMKAATDNAEEMIADLTLSYNRVRQAEITKQIVEIIGAAEAL